MPVDLDRFEESKDWQIPPEARSVTSDLVRILHLINNNHIFDVFRNHTLESDRNKVWKIPSKILKDTKYGTKPYEREWIYSATFSRKNPDITLSVITNVTEPGTNLPFPCQREIRIRLPLSINEILSGQFVSFGDLGVCLGLRLPGEIIIDEDGGNPITDVQVLKNARLVINTFISYLYKLSK